MLQAADVVVDVRHTQRPGHAREIAALSGSDIIVPDAILCCGGDGLIGEV